MRKILKVASREFLDTVQTKTFLVGLLMVPLIFGIIWFISKDIGRPKKAGAAQKVVVTNLAEGLSGEIQSVFDNYKTSGGKRPLEITEARAGGADFQAISAQYKELLRKGKLDLYVVLEKDVVEGQGKMLLYTRGARLDDMEALSTVENLINQAVTNLRCRQRNISPDLLKEIRRRVPTEQVALEVSGGKERRGIPDILAASMVPFFFVFMMFMGVVGHNQHLLTSILEEKNSRIIEVLLSAISPFQLLAGKVLGMGAVGLTVMGLWTGTAIAAAAWRGVPLEVSPRMVVCFISYYVMGFLLISCIFAGIGSVCNTLKEAQSLVMPISVLLMLPVVSWFPIYQNPEWLYARVLSFIPPTAPMAMMIRLSSGRSISTLEILASMAVLAASLPAAVWAGAKIFRTGILMYGKKPRLGELVRWLRQK
jgi:ABC-2 type transport system permease protein